MIYKIKDPKQINYKTVATSFIRSCGDTAIGNKILKGIAQRDTITSNTEFTSYMKNYSFKGYSLLENKDIIVVTKESNIIRVKEMKDIYASLGIRNIIKSDKVTVMIPEYGKKVMIKKDDNDEDDNLKAVMILILKQAGYSIDDIYTVANSLPYNLEKPMETEVISSTKRRKSVKEDKESE